nr:immunoglobulin light chain junction region [Macaca mulatta]MOX86144.1 immunoglobulin light chain junction region [Macaca mulatta]MOX87092.1 immunoglobulin light chain junction region [Macaca mulatta]MOX87648.1 immunoglobulin light chain junction region [Macaca mulatta]MOX87945.1 immunoglobulin light chain junction region [Macaca mulatta]
CQQSDRNPPTF